MLPVKIVVTASIDEQTHLVSVIATPENAPPRHLTNGTIRNVNIGNTRDLPGFIKFSNGEFVIEFKNIKPKSGAKIDYRRSMAVFLCELWWERFGKGSMKKIELAAMLGYSDDRALRDAVTRVRKSLNFHDKTIILQSSEDGKNGFAISISDIWNRCVDENGNLIEISGEGWIWVYGNAHAEFGTFHLKAG